MTNGKKPGKLEFVYVTYIATTPERLWSSRWGPRSSSR
jgi:hypothetical protein